METETQLNEEDLKEKLEEIKKKCIFCNIIKGKIPSNKIYEDDNFIVILDVYPANEGHMLILPKEHIMIYQQMPAKLIKESAKIIKAASHSLLKTLKVEGVNVIIASGSLAGQKSLHTIIHIIPRYKDDNIIHLKRKVIDEKEIQKLTDSFKTIIDKNKNLFKL